MERAASRSAAGRPRPARLGPRAQPLGGQVAPLRQRDQLLGVGPKLLRLRRRRLDAPVAEQAGGHVPQQRLLVLRGAAQGAPLVVVPPGSSSLPAPSPAFSSVVSPLPGVSPITHQSVPSSPCPRPCPQRRAGPAGHARSS